MNINLAEFLGPGELPNRRLVEIHSEGGRFSVMLCPNDFLAIDWWSTKLQRWLSTGRGFQFTPNMPPRSPLAFFIYDAVMRVACFSREESERYTGIPFRYMVGPVAPPWECP